MPADLRDVVALVQRDGVRSFAALASLAPDDAADALVEARYPQYAARAVELLGDALGDAFARKAEAAARHDPGAHVLLCGMLAAHRRRGTALDARFDPWLADAVRTHWTDEVHQVLREGLAALPTARREAAVFGDGMRVAWRYLPTCTSGAARALAVRVASLDPKDDNFPKATHDVVAGLAGCGDAIAPVIAGALRGAECSRAGRRALVAALARLDGEADALRACADDPDPLVRRLARDGLDRRRVALPPAARVPDDCLRARALRASVTDDERRATEAHLRAVVADAADSGRTVDVALAERAHPVPGALRAFAATAEVWIDALRCWRWDPPFYVIELVMRGCLQAAGDDPLAPWMVADTLCRIPPDDLDPMRQHHAFLTLPEATLGAVARALGEVLSPEDAGNPLHLYDWLATRAAPTAPAFARGLVDPDPRVRFVCERVTGRRRVPDATWSLRALRRAFDALSTGAHYGDFRLLAVDHETQTWEAVTPNDEREALSALDEAALALTLEGQLGPDVMPARMLSALGVADESLKEATWAATTQNADGMIRTAEMDSPRVTHAEVAARVEALLAVIGPSHEERTSNDVASAAWSVGWFFQDAARRFSVLVVYVNDQ